MSEKFGCIASKPASIACSSPPQTFDATRKKTICRVFDVMYVARLPLNRSSQKSANFVGAGSTRSLRYA